MSTALTMEAEVATEVEAKPVLTEEQTKALLEYAIEKRERLAESRLEMARMFLQSGKNEIALRRLKEILSEFDGSSAATEAKKLMKAL